MHRERNTGVVNSCPERRRCHHAPAGLFPDPDDILVVGGAGKEETAAQCFGQLFALSFRAAVNDHLRFVLQTSQSLAADLDRILHQFAAFHTGTDDILRRPPCGTSPDQRERQFAQHARLQIRFHAHRERRGEHDCRCLDASQPRQRHHFRPPTVRGHGQMTLVDEHPPNQTLPRHSSGVIEESVVQLIGADEDDVRGVLQVVRPLYCIDAPLSCVLDGLIHQLSVRHDDDSHPRVVQASGCGEQQ